MARFPFSDRKIDSLKVPTDGQIDHYDTRAQGLGIRLSYGGKKTWFVRYSHGGHRRRFGLGPIGHCERDGRPGQGARRIPPTPAARASRPRPRLRRRADYRPARPSRASKRDRIAAKTPRIPVAIPRDRRIGHLGAVGVTSLACPRTRVNALNQRRKAKGEPPLDFGLALHVGDVMYGNLGIAHRMQFTVIGAAANETARLAGMCREMGRWVLVSSAFPNCFPGEMVSLGHHTRPF